MPEPLTKTGSFNVIKIACIFAILYITGENGEGTKSQLSMTKSR